MLCLIIDVINPKLLVHFLGEFHCNIFYFLHIVGSKLEPLVISYSTKIVIVGKLCFHNINLIFFLSLSFYG
jgi:hypothetical protein